MRKHTDIKWNKREKSSQQVAKFKRGTGLSKLCDMINVCKLNEKMLLRVFCVILLTSLRNISGTNSDQTRQVAYEKCRGPGEFFIHKKSLKMPSINQSIFNKVNPGHAKTFCTNGGLRWQRKNAQPSFGAVVMETFRIALTLRPSVSRIASVEIVIKDQI